MKNRILYKLLVVSLSSVQLTVSCGLFAADKPVTQFVLPENRYQRYLEIQDCFDRFINENITIKMKNTNKGKEYWAYQAIQKLAKPGSASGQGYKKYESIKSIKELATDSSSLNIQDCNRISNAYEEAISNVIKRLLSNNATGKKENNKENFLNLTMGWLIFETFNEIWVRDEEGYVTGINYEKVKNTNKLFDDVYYKKEGNNIKEKIFNMFEKEKQGGFDTFIKITGRNDIELFKKSWTCYLTQFFVICDGKINNGKVDSVIKKVAAKNSEVFTVFDEDAPPSFNINNQPNNNYNINNNINNYNNNNPNNFGNNMNSNIKINNNYNAYNNMNNQKYNQNNNINFNNANYNNTQQNNMFNKNNNINYQQGMNYSQNNLNYNNNMQNNLKLKKPKPLDGRSVSKGLTNIGSTCYMNSTLQCLAHIPELSNYLLSRDNLDIKVHGNDNLKSGNILTDYFKEVVKQIWEIPGSAKLTINRQYTEFAQKSGFVPQKITDYKFYDFFAAGNLGHYAPYEFKERLGKMNELFKKFEAGDAKDLIIYILEQIHGELKKSTKDSEYIKLQQAMEKAPLDQYNMKNSYDHFIAEFTKELSIISDNFFGSNTTTNICQNCRNYYSSKGQKFPICYNFQIFNCLIMPLEEVKNMRNITYQNYNMFVPQPNTVSLQDCFVYNQKTDFFTGENKNYCNICKQLSDSYYTSTIYSMPKVLIVILNRGKNNIFNVKLDFPLEFNINNFSGQKFVVANGLSGQYDLVGVITHIGKSGPSAHFVASCRMPNGRGGYNSWYRYNDSIVSQINDFEKDIVNYACPYVLFYRLRD